jgi:hypothetical protein
MGSLGAIQSSLVEYFRIRVQERISTATRRRRDEPEFENP